MTETDYADDLFGAASGGKFPKVEDLEGKLLLIRPTEVKTVRNKFDKDGSKPTVERATADVTVFEDDGTYETHLDMYLSQTVLLNACISALKPGRKPMVLGRLQKVATKETQEKLKIDGDAESFAAARAEWLKKGGKGIEPRHVWILAQFTPEDAQAARSYLATLDPFAADAASA
jgi:hypothetical protein